MLDSRIPLMAQGLNLEPRSNALMRAAQLQGAEQSNALRRMQMEQIQAQAAQALQDRQAQEAQRAQMNAYLQSLSGQAGPPEPFNPARAAQMVGLEGAKKLHDMMAPKGDNGFTLTPGAIRYGPDGKQIASAPVKPDAPPELVRLMQFRDQLPPNDPRRAVIDQAISKSTTHAPGVSVSYGAPVAGVDSGGNPVFFQPAKGGGAPAIIPGVAPPKKDKALTEAQAKAAAFVSQMGAAEKELSSTPIDATKLWSQIDIGIASGPGNIVASPAAQRARQAQEQWAEAFLRFKTGAASTADEVRRNIRTYFPQPGDSPDVIAQKKRQRDQAVSDVAKAAGGSQQASEAPTRAVKRTGMHNGRKVVEYSDGSIEYAD